MPYRSLADFLEDLGRAGELARVDAQVDPVLEVAEVTRRAAQGDGPALLFTAVCGHDMPVLTNLLGTEARICRALEVDSLGEAAARIDRLIHATEPDGWFERLRVGSHAGPLASLQPRRVKAAPCQQVVRLGGDVNLQELPLLQCASQESARAILTALTLTAEPDSHRMVAGCYDFQLLGRDRLAISWPNHEEPARLVGEYRRRSGKMPLAIVLGGDPAGLLAAAAPVPQSVDPLALAGMLRERPLDAVACRSIDLQVPAEADIVLEGYLDPNEPAAVVGPLATPLGYLTRPQSAPVMRVTAVTHRANPVYAAIVHAGLPNERTVIDRAMVQVFLPLLKVAIPELVDCDMPLLGGSRCCAVVSVRKTYAGLARRVASIAWGLRQFLFAKLLIVVDHSVDVRDLQQVFGAMALCANPARDVFFQEGLPDGFDPTLTPGALSQKMAIDATTKLPEECGGGQAEATTITEDIRELVSGRWPQYGLGTQ